MVDALVPTDADLEFLRKLIVQHQEETDSDVAESLLADWHSVGRRFTKVLPRDYARVIAARRQGESEGLDEAMITTKMMEAAHG
jgi:glutamate synthase (NADPH) large chain